MRLKQLVKSLRARSPKTRTSCGQATVEFALLVPLIFVFLMGLFQIGLLLQRQILVIDAAREGARKAAVVYDLGEIESAVRARTSLAPARLSFRIVRPATPGEVAKVTVIYRDSTNMPVVGALIPNAQLSATAAMTVEQ